MAEQVADPAGEFALIRRHFMRGPTGPATVVPLGIGDDCALLQVPVGQQLAVSSDMLIEGRHFFIGTDPAAIGHKALAVNLSDLAAMAAAPLGFTLAIALPALDDTWLQAFTDGLFALARVHGCPLVGGDTTRGPLAISITVFGAVAADAALRRDAARVDDDLWVTGSLGAAALAVRQRRDGGAVDALAARRLDWPQPRLDCAALLGELARAGQAHAAIDLSDGLAGDLGHVLSASATRLGVALGAEIDAAALPVDAALVGAGLAADDAVDLALSGGDDYELLFTAPPGARAAIVSRLPGVHRIGRVVAGQGILLRSASGAGRVIVARGFDHFAR